MALFISSSLHVSLFFNCSKRKSRIRRGFDRKSTLAEHFVSLYGRVIREDVARRLFLNLIWSVH